MVTVFYIVLLFYSVIAFNIMTVFCVVTMFAESYYTVLATSCTLLSGSMRK